MPASAIPFLVAVVAFFGTFMVVVGGGALWCALDPNKPDSDKNRA